jgi:hypothetical protein
MRGAQLAPLEASAQEKVYSIDEHVFGRVSAQAMGYIEEARKSMPATFDPWDLLKAASQAARGKDEVQMNLYTYARFELDLHPKELSPFFNERASRYGMPAAAIREICINAVKFRKKRAA